MLIPGFIQLVARVCGSSDSISPVVVAQKSETRLLFSGTVIQRHILRLRVIGLLDYKLQIPSSI